MNIRFELNKASAERTSIMLILAFKNLRWYVSTGQSIETANWNQNKQKVKGTDAKAIYLNRFLKQLKSEAESIYYKFYFEPSLELTRENFQNAVKDFIKGKDTQVKEDVDLYAFIDKHFIDYHKKKEGKETYKSYGNLKYNLQLFSDHIGKKLTFKNIDNEMLFEFKEFLLDRGHAPSYCNLILRKLKTVWRKAKRLKFTSTTPFEDFKFMSEPRKIRVSLSNEEVDRLFYLDLSNYSQSFIRARDAFVLGCVTALRVSDYLKLTEAHIRDEKIYVTTTKTDTSVIVPLHPYAKHILANYQGNPIKIAQPVLNRYIKEVAKLAGIDTPIIEISYSGRNREQVVVKKYEKITSHTARRTGATNMYLDGMDIEQIRRITGHTTIKQLLTYIAIDNEQAARLSAKNKFFKTPIDRKKLG
jgi:integrase